MIKQCRGPHLQPPFFGFPRASVFRSRSLSSFDVKKTFLLLCYVLLADVAISHIKSSECDQFGKAAKCALQRRANRCTLFSFFETACPSVSHSRRPIIPLLLRCVLGSSSVCSDLDKSLSPPSGFQTSNSSHSFRLHITTCAAVKRTPAWLITALGHRASNRFEEHLTSSSSPLDRISGLSH